MRDLLYPAHEPSEPDPVKRAQNAMARHALPKRFYKAVTVAEEAGRFAIKLDGRGARTPARRILDLPTEAAAALVAQEWDAQQDIIDPAKMPATRLVNTALDGVSAMMADVAAEIAAFAGSDLVCYRAADPAGLVQRQCEHWDPVTTWAADTLGARFMLAQGIIHVTQPGEALAAVEQAIAEVREPVALAALHVMTTISGSCLIALKAARGDFDAEAAWAAATVDDAWSQHLWGYDSEAAARLAMRREEFLVALAMLKAAG